MSATLPDIHSAVSQIEQVRREVPARRSVLVSLSGIDGSGKGFVTSRIAAALQESGLRVATINIDGWLNLPNKRFSEASPAEHFYHHAIRFDEMFAQLIFPLRDARSLRVEADLVEETAREYRKHTYEFANIDVIALEGVFLLKQAFVAHYDLSVWIDCSFETALERAISRSQEGLPPEETIRAYRTIFFPAQEIHSKTDDPKAAADILIKNDPKLG